MVDYLSDFYKKLISSVLDPVATWILELSWKTRVLALLITAATIVVWERPAMVGELTAYSGRAFRVLTADANSIPLAASVRERVTKARARLLVAGANDVNLADTGALTGWSATQTLLAIGQPGKPSVEEEKLVQYIRATRLAACSCWPELNGEDETKAWTFVSGWVMAALANKRLPATEPELAFLLNQQYPDGSWPSMPQKGLTEFESVYATSWAVIGLLRQVEANLIANPVLATQAKTSVQRGAAWLLSKRQANARWKPYPNLQSSSISGSVSGIAMHALHLAVPAQMAEIDKAWLDNVPASPVPASLGETNYVEIKRGGTLQVVQVDHFVQLTMPWMLTGTIDAYHSGSVLQKTRALTWLEQTLSHESVKNADAEQGNWWRAELLIALNHLHESMEWTTSK